MGMNNFNVISKSAHTQVKPLVGWSDGLKKMVQVPTQLEWGINLQRPGELQINVSLAIDLVSITRGTGYATVPLRQMGSKNSWNPLGMPRMESLEYPSSGNRNGRWRSSSSSSRISPPSPLRTSVVASAKAATRSISAYEWLHLSVGATEQVCLYWQIWLQHKYRNILKSRYTYLRNYRIYCDNKSDLIWFDSITSCSLKNVSKWSELSLNENKISANGVRK